MEEIKIQRVSFEEIKEFFKLNLDDMIPDPTDKSMNSIMLVYDVESHEFLAVPVIDGTGGSITINNSKAELTKDIETNPAFDWVIDKHFGAGMTFQAVMEQLLTARLPAKATLAVVPSMINAWTDKDVTLKIIYISEGNGDMRSVTGTYDSRTVTYTLTSKTEAEAVFKSGKFSLNNGQHSKTVPVAATIKYTRIQAGGTQTENTIKVTAKQTIASPVLVGFVQNRDIAHIKQLVIDAIDGKFVKEEDEKSRVTSPQNSAEVRATPFGLVNAYHWVASTRRFKSWYVPGTFNNGEIVNTHEVITMSVKNGVTYYLHLLKEKTEYDNNLNLMFK